MEFFRVSRNAWGQETLIGVSWDLLWVFMGAAILFIFGHIIYKKFWSQMEKKLAGDVPPGGDARG